MRAPKDSWVGGWVAVASATQILKRNPVGNLPEQGMTNPWP